MIPTFTVSAGIDIAAPADVVYRIVSDIPQQSRYTVQSAAAEWRDGATGPTVGAKFRGLNRNGIFRWPSDGTVITADEGKHFAFKVTSGGMPISEWHYVIESTATGCHVTEGTIDQRHWAMRTLIGPLGTGTMNRTKSNAANIAATLERLKALAETVR